MRNAYSANPIRATVDLIPWIGGDWWEVTRVEVGRESRGRRVASGLMARVLTDADAEGVTLVLTVAPDGTGLDEQALLEWYTRLGFVVEDDLSDGLGMIRKPIA